MSFCLTSDTEGRHCVMLREARLVILQCVVETGGKYIYDVRNVTCNA